jgi:hypothetical protein
LNGRFACGLLSDYEHEHGTFASQLLNDDHVHEVVGSYLHFIVEHHLLGKHGEPQFAFA